MPILPMGIPQDIEKFFYNREKELKTLKNFVNALNEDIAHQILVTGFRGVGKTYLLKKLVNDLPDNILVAYIDISRIYGIEKGQITEELIMQELLTSIGQALDKKDKLLSKTIRSLKTALLKINWKKYDYKEAGGILGVDIPQVTNDYQKLSHFVMQFPQKIVENSEQIKGFLIIIDEFQLIGELKNPSAFFWMIRSYTQQQNNVSYIFTGSTSKTSAIVDMINGTTGAYGGRMIQFNLDPFSPSKTRGYLEERVPEIQFTDNGFERFYQCTRGIPAYINSFCNTLSAGEVYNEDKVKETFFEKMDQITIMWIRIWGSLSPPEKEILISLAQYGPQNWTGILDKTKNSRGTLSKYLDILKNKGIIWPDEQKKYVIGDLMLDAWLKHRNELDGYYPP
ncbi:MAG: ATPase [Methanobacteriales archaeon Met13]